MFDDELLNNFQLKKQINSDKLTFHDPQAHRLGVTPLHLLVFPATPAPPSFLVPDLPVIVQQMTTRVISFNANEKIETSFFNLPVLSSRRPHSPTP